MISALWLSLGLGISAQPVARPMQAEGDDPAIRVWLNEDGRFQRGDQAKAYVRSREDGYLVVLHVDPDNRLRVLFPLDPDDDNFVRGGKKYQILGRGERETFEVDVRSGRGTVYAAVSRDPFRWDRFVVGDHWDFRALNQVPLSRDIEADLNDVVRQLASVDFDYDFVDYDVYERVYASDYGRHTSVYYSPSYYSSGWDPFYSSGCGGYWGCGGSGLSIGISFGYPYWYYPYRAFYPGYYPYRPYDYPYSYYHYPTYYYPYRPYYPYRYRDPFRHRGYGKQYAGGYYFGGHYSAPWRNRVNDRFYSSSYAWRGREATTDLAQPGRFSTGYRERGFDRGERVSSGGRLADASPRRRADVPAPNMTPARTEGRRPAAVADKPSRAPEGRRAIDRGEPGGGGERGKVSAPRPLPVRVGNGSDAGASAGEGRRAEPRRIEEVRGPSRERDYADRDSDDRRRGYESGVIEGRRGPEARGPEARGPSRAREAMDDRPAPRAEPRPEPRMDPRPQPRSEPRAESRPAPRAEPRREAPPPRMEAPRAEPRSQPAPRDHGGRGRPSRKN
ncbi:MAG: DUF4384 domain-containing protein [Gemmatimonadales bacterium]